MSSHRKERVKMMPIGANRIFAVLLCLGILLGTMAFGGGQKEEGGWAGKAE
jgi:hypothetical protein